MVKAPPTPKGFRDIPPELAKRRRETIAKMAAILEENGFSPMDTPTIEFAETLLGKYGSEADRLVYKFQDRGGRKLALRYDLTVPLARFIVQNPSLIANGKIFSRYQVGQVFRGENPQKGRWREFTQFDIDTVGSSDLKEDAKIIATVLKVGKKLGLKNLSMAINDRTNFERLSKDAVTAIDKLDKIGDEGVLKELESKNVPNAKQILEDIKVKKPTKNLEQIFSFLKKMGVSENEFEFVPTLARGLDYYTGSIFELRAPSYGNLSLGGGGRYDDLIGQFSNKQVPAVGFSFGLDRLLEVLDE